MIRFVMKCSTLSTLLYLGAAISRPDIVSASESHDDDPRAFIVNSDNIRHASYALTRLFQTPTTAGVEDIGSGHVRVGKHNGLAVDSNHDTSARKRSSRTLREGKAPKSKSGKCTDLVAEDGDWETWEEGITTLTPVFRPNTDNELRRIIRNSNMHGCTVRMAGAGGSADGMVMQRNEEDIVVISLASHTTDIEGWADSMNPESSTFRIGAGKSWYDVSALIRPHGFVLKSRTAGAFFSVGGVIANMVHGGGRVAGFVHDDVVRMLVLTSDGSFQEIEGDDLKYWRSSAGQLGMIIAVEMNMHSEAIPYVIGIDPNTGQPVFDFEKGGLVMDRERTAFDAPTDAAEFVELLTALTSKIYQSHATYDNIQFFFDWYSSTLAEYRTDFSGPRFSGATGPFPDEAKAAQYDAATRDNIDMFPDVAITGARKIALNQEIVCEIFCVPPTGPRGDMTPCIQIPSLLELGQLLCEVPLEVAAALSASTQTRLDVMWDAASDANDGFFLTETPLFTSLIVFAPARSFPSIFGTWYDIMTRAVLGTLPDIDFFPSGNLEFRLLNPIETAVLNPIPTIDETRIAFNEKHAQLFGENAFDLLMPPLPDGIPDGYVAAEMNNILGVFDDDLSKLNAVLQEAWGAMPTNPLVPYSEFVVMECDAINEIYPCQGIPNDGTTCCNPPIPSYPIHLGKDWGHGFDTLTTPVTGKLQPFQNRDAINNAFSTGSKQNSVSDFNAKRTELDAGVFSGGAMLRWLDSSVPNTRFEVRKLDGQMCGSLDFVMEPDKECINDSCVESICQSTA